MSGPTKGMVAGQPIQTGAQSKEFDEGYARTFGEPRSRKGGRWRWDEERKEMVEIGADWSDAPRRAPVTTEGLVYNNLQATDGADISSRRKHREYMEHNGLSMVSDFKETWQRAAKERANAFSNEKTRAERKQALADTIYRRRK